MEHPPSGADPTSEAPEEPHRFPRGRLRVAVVAVGVAVVLAVLGSLIRLPYHSIGPGPVRDMIPSIRLRGGRIHPSDGKLLLTTASVSSGTVSLLGALWTFVDPDLGLIGRQEVLPEGRTPEQQDAENVADMERSKVAAEVAAFTALGCDVQRVPGARVLSVVRGAPAHRRLRKGDTILRVDGAVVRERFDRGDPNDPKDDRPVSPAERAGELIGRRSIGDRVRFTVRRRGDLRTVRVRTVMHPDVPDRAYVGIVIGDVYSLPAETEIETARIAGPSGGLVFALALADVLIREDLTRGRTIAVTGTIDLEGNVGGVGAVGEKIRAAAAAGATLFIVPADEVAEARSAAPPSMRVAGVRTLKQALRVLRGKRAVRIPPAACRPR